MNKTYRIPMGTGTCVASSMHFVENVYDMESFEANVPVKDGSR